MARARVSHLVALVVVLLALGACGGRKPPATNPAGATPTAFPGAGTGPETPPPPRTPDAPPPRTENVPPAVSVAPPINVDPLASMTVDDLNRSNSLKPVFFVYDSDQLDEAARLALSENAQVLRKYPSWIVTIEGHCDERGSAEYNLALGDRRAQAARNYLVSLGVPENRVRTVSYGNEFPFDPGHDEAAWAKNRRAQFMVTAK